MANNSSSGGNGKLIVARGRCIVLEHVCAFGMKSGIILFFSLGSLKKITIIVVNNPSNPTYLEVNHLNRNNNNNNNFCGSYLILVTRRGVGMVKDPVMFEKKEHIKVHHVTLPGKHSSICAKCMTVTFVFDYSKGLKNLKKLSKCKCQIVSIPITIITVKEINISYMPHKRFHMNGLAFIWTQH